MGQAKDVAILPESVGLVLICAASLLAAPAASLAGPQLPHSGAGQNLNPLAWVETGGLRLRAGREARSEQRAASSEQRERRRRRRRVYIVRLDGARRR